MKTKLLTAMMALLLLTFAGNAALADGGITVAGVLGENGWYVSDITINAPASDCELVENGGAYYPFAGGSFTGAPLVHSQYTISADGVWGNGGAYDGVCYAKQNTVEVSAGRLLEGVKRDATPPVISSLSASWDGTGVPPVSSEARRVTFSVSDATSGLASVTAEVGGTAVEVASSGGVYYFTMAKNGKHVVTAVDKAGNRATAEMTISGLDDEAPVISDVTVSPEGWTDAAEISLLATDNWPGSLSVDVAGGCFGAAYAEARYDEAEKRYRITVSSSGAYTIRARDAYGNASTRELEVTSVDADAPQVVASQVNADAVNARSAAISYTATDAGRGLARVVLELAGEQTASVECGGEAAASGEFRAYKNGSYTVRAYDLMGLTSESAVDIAGVDERALGFGLSETPPSAVEGESWGAALDISGAGEIAVSLESGALPAGIALDMTPGAEKLAGVASEGSAGEYEFTLKLTDGNGGEASKRFALTVYAPARIVGAASAKALPGEAFSFAVEAVGSGDVEISAEADDWNGLEFSAQGNVISGVPERSGAFIIRLEAYNGYGARAETELTVDVGEMLGVSGAPEGALAGEEYAWRFDIAGNAPLALAVEEGLLPKGLTLDDAGELSGVPEAGSGGEYVFYVHLENGYGEASFGPFELEVREAPTIITEALLDGSEGVPYSARAEAIGYPAPEISLTAGALPEGLALDSATGELSGTPSESGDFAFTLTAANGIGPGDSREYAITVIPLEHVVDPPTILDQPPGSKTVRNGRSTSISITASALEGEVSYQWYKDGAPIEGADEAVCYVRNARSEDAGEYYCVVTRYDGEGWASVASDACDLVYSYEQSDTPPTGDDSNIGGWALLLLMALTTPFVMRRGLPTRESRARRWL